MAIMSAKFKTVPGTIAFYLLGVPLFMILPAVVGMIAGFWPALVTMLVGALITLCVSKAVDSLSARKSKLSPAELRDFYLSAGVPEEKLPPELLTRGGEEMRKLRPGFGSFLSGRTPAGSTRSRPLKDERHLLQALVNPGIV